MKKIVLDVYYICEYAAYHISECFEWNTVADNILMPTRDVNNLLRFVNKEIYKQYHIYATMYKKSLQDHKVVRLRDKGDILYSICRNENDVKFYNEELRQCIITGVKNFTLYLKKEEYKHIARSEYIIGKKYDD